MIRRPIALPMAELASRIPPTIVITQNGIATASSCDVMSAIAARYATPTTASAT